MRVSLWTALSIALLAVLLAAILVPIGTVMLTSFLTSPVGTNPSLTLANYTEVFTDARALPLVINSLVFTLGASIIALILASLFAWAITSLKMRYIRILWLLPLMVMFAPPLLKDPAWIELYSGNTGLVNLALMHWFGLSHPVFEIYSMAGMIVIVGLNMVPIPYLILLTPFESLDRSFLEASEMSGASRLRTTVRIVIPVLMPAFLSALLLTVIIVASTFETPILIGLPARVGTYMASIYLAMSSADPDINLASAQAVSYLALTSLLLAWYLLVTRQERRFTSVTGRGAAPRSSPPGPLGWMVVALLVVHFILTFVMPVGVTIFVSLLPYYTMSAGGGFPPLTFENYADMAVPANLNALINSIVLSFEAVVVAVGAALFLSLIALKSQIRGRRLAEAIGTVPIGIPSIVFSVALLVTVLSIPGVRLFYSTPVPLVLAEMVVFLPFALRIISSALIQIQNELLEASQVSGARPWQTGLRILVPLLLPALIYSAAAVFVMSFRELGAVVLLVTANLNLIPTQTFAYWATGNQGQVAALNMISLVVPLVVVVAAFALVRPRGSRNARKKKREVGGARLPEGHVVAGAPK